MHTLRKIAITLGILITGSTFYAQNAQVQIIHNSPDFALEAIDVYVEENLLVDSIAYRQSTAFLDVPANTDLRFSIQDPGFPDTNGAHSGQTFNLDAGSRYVMVAVGITSDTPYDSLKPVELAMHPMRETAQTSGNVDVLFFNGIPDAHEVTINETSVPMPKVADSIAYAEFGGFAEFPVQNYELEAYYERPNELIAIYEAPFQDWDLEDSAIVILSSGFRDTLQDPAGDTGETVVPRFQLFAAMAGGGPLLPLPIISDVSVPEYATAEVDIYPVPADRSIVIRSSERLNTKATLYNLDGKALQSFTISTLRDEIPLDAVSPGVYLLKLDEVKGRPMVRKIVVE